MPTLVAPPKQLEALFTKLATEWREETRYLSSTSAIATHPAYQRIIGLGPQVIPLILSDLEREGGHWFWALSALTGENPVDSADQGRIKAMTAAWLKWGTDNGWIA